MCGMGNALSRGRVLPHERTDDRARPQRGRPPHSGDSMTEAVNRPFAFVMIVLALASLAGPAAASGDGTRGLPVVLAATVAGDSTGSALPDTSDMRATSEVPWNP